MTPRNEAVKLEKLLIAEVSGVDDPANEIPGFMVRKATVEVTPEGDDVAAAAEAVESTEAISLVGKIKNLLQLPVGKEDLNMDKAELQEILAETITPIAAQVTALSKSVEELANTEAPAVVEATVVDEGDPALTVEDVAKGIEAGIEPILEILEKALDRIEAVEKRLTGRQSVDGQESNDSGDVEKNTNSVRSAIAKALSNGASA